MKSVHRHCLLIALLLTAWGCERSYGRQACRMEHEVLLATSDSVPDEVAVVSVAPSRYLALFSADASTQAVFFESPGNVRRPPFRIPRRTIPTEAPPTPIPTTSRNGSPKTFWPDPQKVSLDAIDIRAVSLRQNRVAAALLTQPSGSGPGGAYLAVIAEEGGVSKTIYLGPAGEYASRISLTATPTGLYVAWHDGMLSGSGIRLVRLDRKTDHIAAQATYTAHTAAASPALASSNGRTAMAWSETATKAGSGESVIKVAVLTESLTLAATKTVATSRFVYPSPDLTVSDDGFALVFRDDEDGDETPEYHFLALDPHGAPAGERQRISTSDGFRGPRLIANLGGFIGVAIRSFQRNLLIGLNRMDRLGRKLGGEFQVYADKSDFVRVDIVENGDQVVMVYAEDRHDKGRILAGTVVCTPREK